MRVYVCVCQNACAYATEGVVALLVALELTFWKVSIFWSKAVDTPPLDCGGDVGSDASDGLQGSQQMFDRRLALGVV